VSLAAASDWRSHVLKFWFALDPKQWWDGSPDLDHRIREDFLKLWTEKRQLPVDAFITDALTALAAVVLFDQFPRNMFRGHADQFSTDHLALAIAKAAIDDHLDEQLPNVERKFLYMPLMHSEKLGDQKRAVLLFTELGDEEQIEQAKRHRDIIQRFGRFPHRNAMLGRAPRPDEIAAANAAAV
jgi:uncharacterized protein (DUF924 family)